MIRRMIQVGLIAVLVAGSWVLRPLEVSSPDDVGFEPEQPTFVGCVGRMERSAAGSIVVGSVVRGDVTMTRVPGGTGDTVDAAIDPAGGATVGLGDIGAAGIVGVLT